MSSNERLLIRLPSDLAYTYDIIQRLGHPGQAGISRLSFRPPANKGPFNKWAGSERGASFVNMKLTAFMGILLFTRLVCFRSGPHTAASVPCLISSLFRAPGSHPLRGLGFYSIFYSCSIPLNCFYRWGGGGASRAKRLSFARKFVVAANATCSCKCIFAKHRAICREGSYGPITNPPVRKPAHHTRGRLFPKNE